MRLFILISFMAIQISCARTEIDSLDVEFNKIEPNRKLSYYAANSLELSKAYLYSAKNMLAYRDSTYALLVVAAGATALGGVFSVPTAEISRYAIIGVAVDQTSKRSIPKTALDAMFTGSKRLNCIATVASFGETLFSGQKDDQVLSTATLGAMRQVHIELYQSLSQEIPSFSDMLGEFDEILKNRNAVSVSSVERDKKADLFEYLKLLNSCLKEGELTNVKKG